MKKYIMGLLYRVNMAHTSNATAWRNYAAKWDIVYASIRDFAYYKTGSFVIAKDNKIYRVLTNHTSSSADLPIWTKVLNKALAGIYGSSNVSYPPHT